MMAFDRTPEPPGLDPETVQRLRLALSKSIVAGAHGSDVREVLVAAAAEARGRGVHAERLLVILKDIWYGMPEVRNAPAPERGHALLQELISRCIREYYSV